MRRSIPLLGLLLFALAGPAAAQFGGFHLPTPALPVPDIPKPTLQVPALPLPGLSQLDNNDLITSNFGDAAPAVPFLDDYDPAQTAPMALMPCSDDGAYHLFPGTVFDFPARSFCLHAGTYGPSHGEGYVDAPLKGPGADTIRHILLASARHPEIAQPDVQTLIWAILAHTKLSQMPPGQRKAAAALLTPSELFSVNGGALGVIPDDLREKLLGGLPDPLRQVADAENNLRQMLTAPVDAAYSDLEQVAVLSGDRPEYHGPLVPSGRWSFRPSQGVFVRYFPSGYHETFEQVSVPGAHTVTRDAQGRIVAVSDPAGDMLSLSYDAVPPSPLGGAQVWAWRSVRFSAGGAKPGAAPDGSWDGAGYVLTGPLSGAAVGGGDLVRFPGLDARLRAENDGWAATLAALKAAGTPVAADSADPDAATLRDLTHLKLGLDSLPARDDAPQARGAALLVGEAWQEAFARLARRARAGTATASAASARRSACALPRRPMMSDDCDGGASFRPSDGAAMPANQTSQRLAQSPVPFDPWLPVGDTPFGPGVQDGCAKHGIPPGDVAATKNHAGDPGDYVVRLGHGDNHALPTQQQVAGSGTSGNEAAQSLLFVFVQQVGDQTRVYTRETNVETGVVTAGGQGTADGTDSSAVAQATDRALGNMGQPFGPAQGPGPSKP